MNPTVDAMLTAAKSWKEELQVLREIILSHHLVEKLKWGKPCYMFEQGNVLSLTPLKESCAVAFFKGALLKDSNKILLKPGENTQSGRWIKFTSVEKILQSKKVLNVYIQEAIEVEKAGLKVDQHKNTTFEYPAEFQQFLDKSKQFNTAFHALTPGRQRAYNMFFSAPKQSSTRITRIEKFRQRILDGKGLNDCTCGLSKKMPSCDGSHKYK
jgi:uncharacterized protein YdeI (YjbR/CyaY-like superfamily)